MKREHAERLARAHGELSALYAELAREPVQDARTPQAATPRRALRARDVAARLGISERSVREMRARGEMPAPLPVPNVVRWDESAIEAWIAGR